MTPENLLEAVTTLEDTERIARRVLGGAKITTQIEDECRLRDARFSVRRPRNATTSNA